MRIRIANALLAFLGLLVVASSPARAEPEPLPATTPGPTEQTAPAPEARPELARVSMVTAMGTITLDLDKTNAPVTTANFLRYARERRFDGTIFYRVMRLDWGTPPNGLIQGGTQGRADRNLKPIAHEPTNETGLIHKTGTISMARYAPGTAAGDFSIMLSPQPGLNAQPGAPGQDPQPGFAAFGQVVEGMDVVRAIYDVPLSPTKGEGFLRGQMIDNPVKILSVREIAIPAPDADTPPSSAMEPKSP